MYFIRFIPILLVPIVALVGYREPEMPFIPIIDHPPIIAVARVMPPAQAVRLVIPEQVAQVMPEGVIARPPSAGQINPIGGNLSINSSRNNKAMTAHNNASKAPSKVARPPKQPKPKKSKGSSAAAAKSKKTKATTTKSVSVKAPKIKVTIASKTKLTKTYKVGH
jgi:hypothetical protein